MKRFIILSLLVLFFGITSTFAQNKQWHGFQQDKFEFEGKKARIVKPIKALENNPWVWRAYFPDWHIEIDSILLSRGFHIAYIDCSDMFGNNESIKIWDKFYEYLINKKRFSLKPALEGVSRGGLYVYAWAKKNPEKVSCIYAEAPVLDFKSWPGGKGSGEGSKEDWNKLLNAYKLTEQEAIAFDNNPIDNLKPLANYRIPIIHVVSQSDSIVPYLENSAIFEKNYKRLGGNIIVDFMHDNLRLQGHHFDIKCPEKYADFIYRHTMGRVEEYENE